MEDGILRRRGLALVLVVGVLGVLAVLGSAFAVLSRLERRAAAQRANATKAWLLARSGIEDATARLDAGQDPEAVANRYGGENWDGDANAALSALEAAGEVYHVTGTATSADVDACPVACAMRPSFFVRPSSGNPDPALLGVDGKQRGYSGFLGSSRSGWSLKVSRPGGFFVNGGDPAAASTTGYNAVLRRMLGNLAEAIDRDNGGANDGSPVDQAEGLNLIDLRPSSGWQSFDQIRAVVLGGSQVKLDMLKPYLGLRAWVDRKVIRPNADAALVGSMPTLWADIKLGRSAPGFEARAPVDLSWARSRRPALIALLAGLSGVYSDESRASAAGVGDPGNVGRLSQVSLALDWTATSDDCRNVAAAILSSTRELATWQQFNDFCDGLAVSNTGIVTSGGPALKALQLQCGRQAKRDLLKANFNPNSDLNKFCPDLSMSRFVDKSDLVPPLYSTEFNLSPRGGWLVSAVGRTLDAQGRTLASRILSATLVQDRMLRLTSQGEFVAGNLGSLDVAGDESGYRAYGSAPFIMPSNGTHKTFGHRLSGLGRGMSLQTYPEPHTVWTAPGTGTPAAWDGQVKLATVETEDNEYAPMSTSMMFLASWTSKLDADLSGNHGSLIPTGTVPVPATNSLWDPVEPGMLQPDGIYEEGMGLSANGLPFDRVLGYQALGNMAPSRGTISFWLKPGVKTSTQKAHVYVNNTVVGTEAGVEGEQSGMFFIQNVSNDMFGGRNNPAFMWENSTRPGATDQGADNKNHEILCRMSNDRGLKTRRWQLMNAFWDMAENPDSTTTRRIYFDRAQAPADRTSFYSDYNSGVGPPDIDFQYANGKSGDPAVLYLGGDGHVGGDIHLSWNSWGPPDAAYDEFAIYDFGPNAGNAAITLTETLALNRFEDGRFYKESLYPAAGGLKAPLGLAGGRTAGEWFSAPMDLGNVRLKSLSWTPIVPRDLRAPAVSGQSEDGDDGPDDGRILFELAHPAVQVPYAGGPAYALDDAGREIPSLLRGCRNERVNRRLNAPFRLHAVFQPNLADPFHKAILDPLTLDDVTVSYRPVDQPALSDWREGE